MSDTHRNAEENEENHSFLSKKLIGDNLSSMNYKIIVWNVWSIMNEVKLNHVLQVFEDNEIDIGCVTETWFDAQKGKFTATIKEAGYKIMHSHREDKRGGGTAILYKSNLKVKPGKASSTKYQSLEYTYVYLRNHSTKTLLLCVYRRQEVSCKEFCAEFEKFFDDLSGSAEVLIVVGDFNVWFEVEGDNDAKKLRTLMNAYGLNQMIQEPTHREGHTLDHVYVNDSQTELKLTVQEGTFGITTDHYPCIMELPWKQQDDEREKIVTRQLGKIDQTKFKEDIQEMVSRLKESDENFETTYNKYKSSAENILNEYAPEVSKNVSKKKRPEWIDEEYKIERAKRRKLEKLWKRSKTEENHQKYVDQRNTCAIMSKEKQETYYSKLIDSASNKQKQLFQVVEKMLDKKDERVLPTHTDPVQLANEFNHFYVDKIEKLRKSIPQTKEPMIIEPKRFDGEKLNQFAPTTVDEVKRIIKEAGMKTSSEDPLPHGAFHMVEEELIRAASIWESAPFHIRTGQAFFRKCRANHIPYNILSRA